MTKNTGGPAYPIAKRTETQPLDGIAAHVAIDLDEGLTIRDHFAGLAMQGALSGYAARHSGFVERDLATFAYRMADAMLAEREKGE